MIIKPKLDLRQWSRKLTNPSWRWSLQRGSTNTLQGGQDKGRLRLCPGSPRLYKPKCKASTRGHVTPTIFWNPAPLGLPRLYSWQAIASCRVTVRTPYPRNIFWAPRRSPETIVPSLNSSRWAERESTLCQDSNVDFHDFDRWQEYLP